jgi:hypothetical protein
LCIVTYYLLNIDVSLLFRTILCIVTYYLLNIDVSLLFRRVLCVVTCIYSI